MKHPGHMGGSRGMVGNSITPGGSPTSMTTANTQAIPKMVDITYLDRVRAICHVLGIGEASNFEPKPGATHAALLSVRNGAAFRESLYADSVESYVPR